MTAGAVCRTKYRTMRPRGNVPVLFAVIVTVFFTSFVLFVPGVSGDTVVLKDGTKEKGLILDEYKDRIILSTVEGEKPIMKSDIKSAIYDSEVRTLTQKGKILAARRQYVTAYHTFARVVELDPDNEEARQKMSYLSGFLETSIRDGVRNRVLKGGGAVYGEPSPGSGALYEAVGIEIEPGDKYASLSGVSDEVSRMGLVPGDRIVEIWGDMTAYMSVDEVSGKFLTSGETRVTIERSMEVRLANLDSFLDSILPLKYRRVIGASLTLEREGIVISSVSPHGPFGKAGIRGGDILSRINGKNTRYMPLSKAKEIILEEQGKEMEIVIKRSVTLWRKGLDK